MLFRSYINQWLDKTFKLPQREYKPRKVKPNELAYNLAQNMLQIATEKGMQLKGYKLRQGEEQNTLATSSIAHHPSEEVIQKLASVLTPVQLNYKFANYLTNKKNTAISLKQPFVNISEKMDDNGVMQKTASIPMSIQEAEIVSEFQIDLLDKYPDRKSMTADQINDEYIMWVTDKYGINFIEAQGHDGYGMYRIQHPSSRLQSYTRVLFMDDFFPISKTGGDPNAGWHTFDVNGTPFRGNGIGWYVKAEIDGDRFDHEFQSDVLPEVRKDFKIGKYDKTTSISLKKDNANRQNEIETLAKKKVNSMLTASGDFLFGRTSYLSNKIFKQIGRAHV